MTKLTKLIAFFAALTFQSFAAAQALWGGTEYGMSVSQVQAQHPTASRPAELSTLYGGIKGLLTLPEIEIANAKFTPIFYFKDEKLVQVTLTNKQNSVQSVIADFRSVSTALRAKYGEEISKEMTKGQASANWLSGKTNITLFAMTMSDSAILNIAYQVRIAQDADKL
jgi:hypothetical protein